MPWTERDAQRHQHKATTAKLRQQWAAVANAELKAHGDDARAIRAANAVNAKATEARKAKRLKKAGRP